MQKRDFEKISDVIWEIPKSFRSDMRVPARVYTTEKMLESIVQDRSTEQLVNVATLPGIRKYAIAMPDVHEGYGFPIGGVAAFDAREGIISPGGVGYDVNCGMRLIRTDLTLVDVQPRLERLMTELFRRVPAGVGANAVNLAIVGLLVGSLTALGGTGAYTVATAATPHTGSIPTSGPTGSAIGGFGGAGGAGGFGGRRDGSGAAAGGTTAQGALPDDLSEALASGQIDVVIGFLYVLLLGYIGVGYDVSEAGWTLSVTDNGVGCPPPSPDARVGLGTGVIKALARQLMARVEITDAQPGCRTAVISNPAAATPGAPPPDAEAPVG